MVGPKVRGCSSSRRARLRNLGPFSGCNTILLTRTVTPVDVGLPLNMLILDVPAMTLNLVTDPSVLNEIQCVYTLICNCHILVFEIHHREDELRFIYPIQTNWLWGNCRFSLFLNIFMRVLYYKITTYESYYITIYIM